MLLRYRLLMARTQMAETAYRSVHRVCSAPSMLVSTTLVQVYTWVAFLSEPAEEIDDEGETEGPQPQPVSDIPSISTLYPKISLNLLLACLPISPAHP
ncbi:unnamed protein product [Lasius platythorax]|uniref:Uncharacterized protein n=1 Tax=Lasius platythorax TaxID=488582 RepID=A0AAV2P4C6_9HYME